MSESKPVKIYVGLPVDDGARPQFWHSVLDLSHRIGDLLDDVTLQINQELGDSLITRARNNIAHHFLQTDCDYLLFLDTDIEFLPEQIARLVSMRKPDAVVCGQYAIKQPELRMCYTRITGEERGPDGLIKVAEAGTGCMLIPRKILETYKAAFPQLEYTCEAFKDQRVSFFDVGVIKVGERSAYKSEDWLFCRRVRQLGFSVLMDTETLLGHWGWCRYPLTTEELIRALVSRVQNENDLSAILADIDKAAQARWTATLDSNSTQVSETCKPS